MFIVKVFIVKVFIVKVFIVKVFIVKVFIVKVFIVKVFIVKVFIVKVFIVKVFIVKVFIVKVFIVKVFIVKAMDHVRSQKSDSTDCYITTINCGSTYYNAQIKSKIGDSSNRLNFEECKKIKSTPTAKTNVVK